MPETAIKIIYLIKMMKKRNSMIRNMTSCTMNVTILYIPVGIGFILR